MGKWNAGNIVAGLAIAGGVATGAALMIRDRQSDGGKWSAGRSTPIQDEWFLQRDTPVCPTKAAIDRSTKLSADQDAFARHFQAAGCTVWPGNGEKVVLVERDWLFCEVAYRGRTGWLHCEHLGRR